MRKMAGTGVSNVFVIDGVVEHEGGGVSYRDLDGLYLALAGAIAARVTQLRPDELRFLRKRLGMTQEDVARLGGKTNQIAAKWEKGTADVPVAEGNLLRLRWMERFLPRGLRAAIQAIAAGDAHVERCPYVLHFVDGAGWSEDIEAARAMAHEEAQAHTQGVIARAMAGQTVEHRYTTETIAFEIPGTATVVAGSGTPKELFT